MFKRRGILFSDRKVEFYSIEPLKKKISNFF